MQAVLAAGAARDRLSYRALRTLAALDPAVAEVTGYTRYRIEGDVGDGTATIQVVDQGGVAAGDSPSRTEADPPLRGTKHRAATRAEVTVARGGADGRTVVLVPETKGGTVRRPHAAARPLRTTACRPTMARPSSRATSGRYAALVDAVTETEPAFDEDLLGEMPVVDLLVAPVLVLAEHWRSRPTAPAGP